MEIVSVINKQIGDQVNAVDARELHAKLQVGRDFTNWIKGRLEALSGLGLAREDVDFCVISHSPDPANGIPRGKTDYFVTLDLAKHLAMMENSERGFAVRQGFIEFEKRFRDPRALLRDPNILLQLLEENARARVALEEENRNLAGCLADAAPKVAVFDRIVECGDTMGFRTAAKLVFEASGAREAEFRTLMMKRGWVQRLDGRLQPAHVGTARGYVTIRDREWTDEDGGQHAKPELRITQKGLTRAIELLLSTEAA